VLIALLDRSLAGPPGHIGPDNARRADNSPRAAEINPAADARTRQISVLPPSRIALYVYIMYI
jgi:hypothetical protein